jgi:hypothetical protein
MSNYPKLSTGDREKKEEIKIAAKHQEEDLDKPPFNQTMWSQNNVKHT